MTLTYLLAMLVPSALVFVLDSDRLHQRSKVSQQRRKDYLARHSKQKAEVHDEGFHWTQSDYD